MEALLPNCAAVCRSVVFLLTYLFTPLHTAEKHRAKCTHPVRDVDILGDICAPRDVMTQFPARIIDVGRPPSGLVYNARRADPAVQLLSSRHASYLRLLDKRVDRNVMTSTGHKATSDRQQSTHGDRNRRRSKSS